jgi:hypothetical protein
LSENFKISAHGLFICLFVCLLGTQKISLHWDPGRGYPF